MTKRFDIVIEWYDPANDTGGMYVAEYLEATIGEVINKAERKIRDMEAGTRVVDAARIELVTTSEIVWTMREMQS